MEFSHAPTGKVIAGHVLDVRKEGLLKALQNYDPMLYLKWNPKKLKGWGCWEVRRRPEYKTVVDILPYDGGTLVQLEYQELDIVHHVLDVAYLNYDILNKLKSMDVWNYGTKCWLEDLDRNIDDYHVKSRQKAQAELGALSRDIRGSVSQLREKVLAGWNPAELAKYWGYE